ncbi:acetyl esterase/lipase [Roseinatronobacter thiooxidans]|uniref:Acetyl esterase/lipase n=1 Tax=Roseinatronobacter thiooxidans TaxID=121821 RepID=A0A2W7Q380_9RHOB|nr:alpha/beta hydrolase [Roseinatronobacter thiooxidans]PZX42146.1 acetyl esterase/lipase [Roseinatronobacter thiooxidans]
MRFEIDWDDAFANGAYIDGAAEFPPRWEGAAKGFRANARLRPDIAYGPHPRERYDLFLPDTPPRGLVVFVHGGYWLKFDKSIWSHLAQGPVGQGWAVALPSYTLAPEATIPQITAQIARAVEHAAGEVAGPICLTGHSAGGHLATRMICADTPLPREILDRIAHVLSISGLHDLRPLVQTQMNAELGLTDAVARRESPALHRPHPGIPVTAWVGGHERPEFLRQSALLREEWARKGCATRLYVAEGLHHFNVIDGLAQADSALTQALLSGLGAPE